MAPASRIGQLLCSACTLIGSSLFVLLLTLKVRISLIIFKMVAEVVLEFLEQDDEDDEDGGGTQRTNNRVHVRARGKKTSPIYRPIPIV